MNRVSSCLVLLIASVFASSVLGDEPAAAAGGGGAEAGDDAFVYEVGRSLALLCPLTLDTGAVFTWKKNGTAVDDLWDVKDRYKLEEGGAKFQIIGRSHEDDFGNYTCASGAAEHTWDVRGKPVSRLPANTNVVEGQKLKLTCKVTGKPYPKVTWLYSNSTDPETNGTEVTLALGARALVGPSEQGVAGAELVLEAARREDAGRYTCSVDSGTSHATVLRVKDMYAALWPFLGICAEVFVLCAVILIYERRRTKPEHEDSDTDNHDQKKS